MAYEYIVNGKRIVLEPDEDLVAVRYKEPAPHSRRASVARSAGLGPFQDRFEVPHEKFTILPVAATPQPRARRHAASMAALQASEEVARVTPVFKLGDKRVVATDRVIVGFKPGTTQHHERLRQYHGTVVEERDGEYVVQLPEDVSPLDVATQLAALDDVEYAEPDFVTIGTHVARYRPQPRTTNCGRVTVGPLAGGDPLATQQYATTITHAVEAWNLQVGDPAITIAILDEGVDTTHEDLRSAIAGSYDAIDDDAFQEPNPWDGHGTACAGLAAAVPNNERGIRGTGGGCSLLAVRMAYSSRPGGNWVTSNSVIRRAIDWAWEHGAAVLSNSWGGGAPSSAISNAFERARTQGRGGKGCVIVIAAGNASGPVDFPGNLPNVLTVSASNEYDEFKTRTSQDGEGWWGSNFGPEVDVAAPGVHNLTTDITAANGYAPGNYVPDFNGTSSATPLVAGAVGLVLSANPNLTEADVRTIIAQTADKVGALPYVNGRNDQFGFGRLNVYRAVQLAQGRAGPGSLEGDIVSFGKGAVKAGAFFLRTAQGDTFLLRRYMGTETAAWPILEAQSLSYLAPFAGSKRTVTYQLRQDTPEGSILWGVSLA